ncbi:hypothetical protein [Hoeflea poritis]|uniref:Uncharacterized protein n=1 Tax=Hoeflea poritis TaxID=2993659 RepID=A0ABT4VMT6_9HYPH|nr:hypothetical protein [Hoeflea poritis]MDA4845981.1 hypothetical protein [Hoeflea poritis]
MSYNYDFTREDGTEVLVTYRISGGGGDYFAGGCWMPGDDVEVEFDKVYGLPEGQSLTAEEYEKIAWAILDDPPKYDPLPDDVF